MRLKGKPRRIALRLREEARNAADGLQQLLGRLSLGYEAEDLSRLFTKALNLWRLQRQPGKPSPITSSTGQS